MAKLISARDRDVMILIRMLLVCFVAIPVVALVFQRAQGPWQMLSFSAALNIACLLSFNFFGKQEGLTPSESILAVVAGFVVMGSITCAFQFVFNNLLRQEAPGPEAEYRLRPEEVVMEWEPGSVTSRKF